MIVRFSDKLSAWPLTSSSADVSPNPWTVELLNVMEKLENPILFAVHPRIRKKVDELIKRKNYKNFWIEK